MGFQSTGYVGAALKISGIPRDFLLYEIVGDAFIEIDVDHTTSILVPNIDGNSDFGESFDVDRFLECCHEFKESEALDRKLNVERDYIDLIRKLEEVVSLTLVYGFFTRTA